MVLYSTLYSIYLRIITNYLVILIYYDDNVNTKIYNLFTRHKGGENIQKQKISKQNNYLVFAMVLIGLVVIFSYGMGNVSAASGNSIYVNGTSGNNVYNGQSAAYDGTNGPKATIKNATGTVNSNGTIYIAKGTYNESNIQINTNMTIIGENQQNTIINGQQSGHSIFTIASGVYLTIINLTLTNGTSNIGGAIANDGDLNVYNSTFTNNKATDGGAISNGDDGALTVNNSTFDNNTGIYGGATWNSGDNSTLTNNIFTNNNGDYGGVIYNEHTGTIFVTNNTFTANTASYGGAIFSYGASNDTNNTFTNNSATGYGGAISILSGSSTESNDIFTTNTALNGGAMFNHGTLTVSDSNFTNNTATEQGNGGAILNGDTLIVTESNFTNNTSNGDGGAIYNTGTASVNFNRIIGNGVPDIYSTGTINANDNWWGTNFVGNDPWDAARTNFNLGNWIILTVRANPQTVDIGNNSTVTADFLHDNMGNLVNGSIPDALPVAFNLIGSGNIYPLNSTTTNETATTTFTGTSIGVSDVLTTVDEQTITTPITINKISTDLTVNNVTVIDNQTSTLKTTLTDINGNLLAGQTVTFSVNGHNYSAITGHNGMAMINYIPYCAGNYNITVNYSGNSNYTDSMGSGLLTVNPSAYLYLQISSSNINPKVGETFTITYKLSNRGPDNATNVMVTVPLPSGFVVSNIKGDGNWNYNTVNSTITWTMNNVTVGDPNLLITGKTTSPGLYVYTSSISSEIYDLNTEGVIPITINTTNPINPINPIIIVTPTTTINIAIPITTLKSANTIPMQHTGLPVAGLILAILSVFGGSVMSRRK